MANVIQKGIQRILGIEKKAAKPKQELVPFSASAVYNYEQMPPMGVVEQLKAYEYSWVNTAVSIRAQALASIQLRLYKVTDDDTYEEVRKHSVIDLIDRVNPFMTFYDLSEHYQATKDLTGDCFWWLLKDGNGKIMHIYPYLRPDYMTVVPDAKKFIAGYVYYVPGSGERIPFDTDEIIHFKSNNPIDPYRGMSLIKAAEYAIGVDRKSQEYNYSFFENGATTNAVVKYKKAFTPETLERLKAQWQQNHGKGNAHKVAFLDNDADYSEAGISQRDMEFFNSRNFSRDEILAIFRVPKSMLGLVEDVNRANGENSKSVFMSDVIVPEMRKFVSTLNEFLLPHFKDERLFLDFENPVPADDDKLLNKSTSAYNAGIMTLNEARELLNLDPVKDGDTVKSDPITIGDVTTSQIKEVKVLKANHRTMVRPKSRTKTDIIQAVVQKEIEKKLGTLIPKKQDAFFDKARIKELGLEKVGEEFWNMTVKQVTPAEEMMSQMLRSQFRRQNKEIQASLNVKADSFKFDVAKEEGIFTEIFSPFLNRLIKERGEAALRALGLEGFDVTAEVNEYLRTKGLLFAKEVNETTQKQISLLIEDALSEGQSINQIRQAIQDKFAQYDEDRADKIARTEVFKSGNFGTLQGYKQSGVVESKQWYTALDERVEQICKPLHGKAVKLNSTFNTKDDLFERVQMPPAHVRCRCILLPILRT